MHPTAPPHLPVLLDEALAALALRADGVYVNGTFGRGGHARAWVHGASPPGADPGAAGR